MDIGFLRNHPLTFGLRAEQLQHLGGMLEAVELAPGDQILGEGVPARGLFIFREGRLRVTQKGTGKARTLAELDAPTVVGELELASGAPSAATVTALTASAGALLDAEAFGKLVDAGDPAVTKLLRNVARVLAQRLVATNRRLATLVAPAKQAEAAAVAGQVGHTWTP